jgi:hypothetical protein
MKHPARWLTALALAACALAWWWNRPPPEPRYEGKPLSQWMREHQTNRSEDIKAVRSLGSSAVPWLAYVVAHGDSDDGTHGVVRNILAKIRPRAPVQKGSSQYNESMAALILLSHMRDLAKPAIPALVRVINGQNYDEVRFAADTLNSLGPVSLPAVEDQAIHGSNIARCELLNTLWLRVVDENSGASTDEYARILALVTNALHDHEANIRRNAATSLEMIVDLGLEWVIPGEYVDEAAVALGNR